MDNLSERAFCCALRLFVDDRPSNTVGGLFTLGVLSDERGGNLHDPEWGAFAGNSCGAGDGLGRGFARILARGGVDRIVGEETLQSPRVRANSGADVNLSCLLLAQRNLGGVGLSRGAGILLKEVADTVGKNLCGFAVLNDLDGQRVRVVDCLVGPLIDSKDNACLLYTSDAADDSTEV